MLMLSLAGSHFNYKRENTVFFRSERGVELEIIHVSPGLSALFPMNSDPEIEFFVGQLRKFVFVSASVTNHTINILISFLCFFWVVFETMCLCLTNQGTPCVSSRCFLRPNARATISCP